MDKIEIGDRVRVRSYEDLPDEQKSASVGRLCGKEGEVVDRIHSEAAGEYSYILHLDGYDKPSATWFLEKSIEKVTEARKYRFEVECLDNVVTARFIEIDQGGNEEQIGRGHGHILHDGVYGIAQAASYALNRIRLAFAEE